MPTVGESLSTYLEDAGITHVFGIPGVHNVELYRGLTGSAIRHITPRHEQGAGFMADGFARATGRPAACFTITGPGLTNILTAMGQAYADSVPMLVVASVNERAALGRQLGLLHEIRNQRQMAAQVAGFSRTALEADEVPEAIAEAIESMTGARPRPAYVEIPTDVLAMPAVAGTQRGPSSVKPTADAETITRASEALIAANRAVCILGGGSVSAEIEARRLVEALQMPTVLTVNARGILPSGHPLIAGANLAAPAVRDLVWDADLVIAIGTELGETEMAPLPIPVAVNGRLLRIDLDPHQLSLPPVADLPIHSDARTALGTILQCLSPSSPEADGARRAMQTRTRLERGFPDTYRTYRDLFRTIGTVLPGYRLVGDSTQPIYAATEFLQTDRPRRFFSASTGFGTLGYALPAGIGACLAEPDVPTVVVVGDGGFMFTLSELATAVASGCAPVIVVWNNDGYREIRDAMLSLDIVPVGVDHPAPDLVALARAFGCRADKAKSFAAFADLLSNHQAGLPTLIVLDATDFT